MLGARPERSRANVCNTGNAVQTVRKAETVDMARNALWLLGNMASAPPNHLAMLELLTLNFNSSNAMKKI